mmetsp:Transcript_19842/g.55318  ORF Transcript_19842/g.55318 Transcript_19842/m.55318 type:complete len:200 (-) Transcript_19842:266-865(-)
MRRSRWFSPPCYMRLGAIIMRPSMPQIAMDSNTPSEAMISFHAFTDALVSRVVCTDDAFSLFRSGRSIAFSPLSIMTKSKPTSSIAISKSNSSSSGNRYDSGNSSFRRSSCMVSSVSRNRSLIISGFVPSPSATLCTRWACSSSLACSSSSNEYFPKLLTQSSAKSMLMSTSRKGLFTSKIFDTVGACRCAIKASEVSM